MDNMFQVRQNMTQEQLQQFEQERLQKEENLMGHINKRDEFAQMSAETLRARFQNQSQAEELRQQPPVQDMPQQTVDEKESKRIKREKAQFKSQMKILTKQQKEKEKQQPTNERLVLMQQNQVMDAEAKRIFSETLRPDMFTPKYVLEHFAEVRGTLDSWKEHIQIFEQGGAGNFLTTRDQTLRLAKMRELYQQGELAFRAALGALGYQYDSQKKDVSAISELEGEERRQIALEENRELRAAIAEGSAKMDEEVADTLLGDVQAGVQQMVVGIREDLAQDPKFSFIQSDKLSQIYQYDEIVKAKELMESHPEEYAQNKETVDKLYEELFHLMEVVGVHYQGAFAIMEIQGRESMLDSSSRAAHILQDRLEKHQAKMDVIRERAEAMKAGLKFLLTGKQPAESLSYILRDFVPIQDVYQQEKITAEEQAGIFVNCYQASLQDERLIQAHQEKKQWEEQKALEKEQELGKSVKAFRMPLLLRANREKERELGKNVKPLVWAYLERVKNFDTRFLDKGKPEDLIASNAELQELYTTGLQMADLEKIVDPDDPDGHSILDTFCGEEKELFALKCSSIQAYALKARAFSMIKAYKQGSLKDDAFTQTERNQIREKMGVEENAPLTKEQLLFAAKEMLELAEVSKNAACNKYFKSPKMVNSTEGMLDLKVETAHPVYAEKIAQVKAFCAQHFQVSIGQISVSQLKEIYRQCAARIKEIEQELETMEEPGMAALELQEELEKNREYQEYAQIICALSMNVYKRAGDKESLMKEPMFRSYDSSEGLPAIRAMGEEEYALMCKKMSAGALAEDRDDPVQQEKYYAENMEGLRMYKEQIRQHYEMLEENFHHQLPSIEYIMEHKQQLDQWFANTQMDTHIMDGMRDLIDLTNPEDLRLYHLVNYYNAMGGFISNIKTTASMVVPDYKDAEDVLCVTMREQEASRQYLEHAPEQKEHVALEAEVEQLKRSQKNYKNQEEWKKKMEAAQSPLLAEKFRQIAADAPSLVQADETALVRYLQRVAEMGDYISQYGDVSSMNMRQFKGWMELIQRRLVPVAQRLYSSRRQGQSHQEFLDTTHILKRELESGDPERFLNAAWEICKMTGTMQVPNLTREELSKEQQNPSWIACEDVEYENGVDALSKMPQEFITAFIERLYQKKEALVTRMEEEIAGVMRELPAEMEVQEKKLLATYIVDETEFGREYNAMKILSDTYFQDARVLDTAKVYLDQHTESLKRYGAMDQQVTDAFIKFDKAFVATGFAMGVGEQYLKEFHLKFPDKQTEAKKANPHADADSFDILLVQNKADTQADGEDFPTLAQKLGTLQVTDEMLKPEYMISHMDELLLSFKEMDAYQNLLNANPQLEETIPAGQKIAWTKNRGTYETYREYVTKFARTKCVDVVNGEYLKEDTYISEREELDKQLSQEKKSMQELLGNFGTYSQQVEDLVQQVNQLKKLKKQDKTNVLKPLQEAGEWLKDLTRYLGQPFDISNEDFFDATIMTLMSMFGYIEKDLHETVTALTIAAEKLELGDVSGLTSQLQEISSRFTAFKEHVPGQAQELRHQILDSKEEIPLTLRDIVLSAQLLRTFQLRGEQENVGAGTSDVIKVKEGDKVFFFKEEEKVKKTGESVLETTNLIQNADLRQVIEELLNATDKLQQQEVFFNTISQVKEDGTFSSPDAETLFNDFVFANRNFSQLIRENREDWGSFAHAASKRVTGVYVAEGPGLKLERGADLTARNYASERVAELLGLKGLIVRNQKAVVTGTDGVQRKGFIMEQAKGIPAGSIGNLATDLGYEIHFTGDAQKQLLNLQILDNIISQTDRHAGNYFLEYSRDDEAKTLTVTGVTGIDNDFAFGKSEMLGGGNTAPLLTYGDNKFKIGMMDRKMYDSLMTLSPELLATNLENVIEPEYMEALKNRYEKVRAAVRQAKEEAERNGVDFFRQQEGWGIESEKLLVNQRESRTYINDIKPKKVNG